MEILDLVALSILPAGRGRLAAAADFADHANAGLDAALDLLEVTTSPDTLRDPARAAIARAAEAGILPVARNHPFFPRLLKEIPSPPLLLWVKGDVGVIGTTAVAIVGSRQASHGGLEISRQLASDLAAIGVTVVSGMARGCDAMAHRGALSASGRTVAVLGCGPDVVYPPEHDALAEQIARCGAIVSEFPPGTPPLPLHFPQRNRIISGLSRGVVVIEAGEKSGSLITAGAGLEQGKAVMVVPGPVLAGRNRGGHALIRDGATLVETAEDVVAALVGHCGAPLMALSSNRETVESKQEGTPISPHSMGPDACAILAALDIEEARDLDALADSTRLPIPAILAGLSALELSGLAVRLGGGRFVRPGRK